MAGQPTTALCSEEQIQSMVRNIFGELFEAEQSGSSSQQHSSVASEINQRFRLPRNAVSQPTTSSSSGSIAGQSSSQGVAQPVLRNVPQALRAAVPSFNAHINYGNPSFARTGPIRPQQSQNRRTSYRRNDRTSASLSSSSERNETFMKDVCLLPQACNKVPRRDAKTKLQNEGCFVDAFIFDKRWDEPTLRLKILALFSNMLDSENRYGYYTQSSHI